MASKAKQEYSPPLTSKVDQEIADFASIIPALPLSEPTDANNAPGAGSGAAGASDGNGRQAIHPAGSDQERPSTTVENRSGAHAYVARNASIDAASKSGTGVLSTCHDNDVESQTKVVDIGPDGQAPPEEEDRGVIGESSPPPLSARQKARKESACRNKHRRRTARSARIFFRRQRRAQAKEKTVRIKFNISKC